MVEVAVGDSKARAEYSVWTLSLYEQEFGGANMLADLFKRVELSDDEPEEGDGAEEAAEEVAEKPRIALDFGAQDWATLARALWAGIRTADDSTPSFKEWAAEAGDIDMFEVAAKVPAEVMRRCFRAGAGPSA